MGARYHCISRDGIVGAVVCPFAIWAFSGFPGEGSHGLWMPVMFALYFGLPGGVFFGVIFGLIALCFTSKDEDAEAELREAMKR